MGRQDRDLIRIDDYTLTLLVFLIHGYNQGLTVRFARGGGGKLDTKRVNILSPPLLTWRILSEIHNLISSCCLQKSYHSTPKTREIKSQGVPHPLFLTTARFCPGYNRLNRYIGDLPLFNLYLLEGGRVSYLPYHLSFSSMVLRVWQFSVDDYVHHEGIDL